MGSCQAGCFLKINNYKGDIIFQENTPRNVETQIDFQKKRISRYGRMGRRTLQRNWNKKNERL